MIRALSLWSSHSYLEYLKPIFMCIYTHTGCACVYLQNISIFLVKVFFNIYSHQHKQGHKVITDQENTAISQVVLFWKPRGQYHSCWNKGNDGYLWMTCKNGIVYSKCINLRVSENSCDFWSNPQATVSSIFVPQGFIFTLCHDTSLLTQGVGGHTAQWIRALTQMKTDVTKKRSRESVNAAKAKLPLLAATTYTTPRASWTTDWL